MADKKPSLTIARPRFETLEEFKESINAMANSIVPNLPSDDITDEEWEEYYKKFIEGMKKGEEKNKKEE